MNIILAMLAAITTIITFWIAYSIVKAIQQQGYALNMLKEAILKETKASVMQKCTETYIIIRRQRSKATQNHSTEIAKDYYREIFDLHWAEYRHYSEGLIPPKAMKAWLAARKRNYDDDRIEIEDPVKGVQTVSYADEWKYLLKTNYFEKDDPFVTYMNEIHEGKIDLVEGK